MSLLSIVQTAVDQHNLFLAELTLKCHENSKNKEEFAELFMEGIMALKPKPKPRKPRKKKESVEKVVEKVPEPPEDDSDIEIESENDDSDDDNDDE